MKGRAGWSELVLLLGCLGWGIYFLFSGMPLAGGIALVAGSAGLAMWGGGLWQERRSRDGGA